MFNKLMDLSYERSLLEAVVFYVIYFILFLLLVMLLGAVAGILFGAGYEDGVKLGWVFAIVACPVLSVAVLVQKKQMGSIFYVFIAILSGFCALFVGSLLGLVPVAFLTTRKAL
jgi:hypothetical protein